MKTFCLIILILLIIKNNKVFGECEFKSGIRSQYGTCLGPVDVIKAKRKEYRLLNYGCAIDKVPFTDVNNEIKCGDCIPRTNGNWRFEGIPTKFHYFKRETCKTNQKGKTECFESKLSITSPLYFCSVNEYCSEYGECKPMAQLDNYKQKCNFTDPNPCGTLGLKCIANQCIICKNDLQHFPNSQTSMLESAYCVNGKYTMSKWKQLVQPKQFFTFFTLLVIIYLLIYFTGLPIWIGKRIKSEICKRKITKYTRKNYY
ncbi:hypothetical protein M0813_08890 [Anaeramoeba flamelloides]|uniref:Uncharacterized protein n=1 Tax=Anaeramoeba flamelloides TaxID=1746091 RepID=A0ABQ8X847_9EUKA|nr:hypothetical protein M0813_08890 [Anaeramoeba flamelloides]